MWGFKNSEETREQEEARFENNLAFDPQQRQAHTASTVRSFLEKGNIEVLAHSMYSTDLISCTFWVFGTLKWERCNRHFESDVKSVTPINRFFQDLPPEELHKMATTKWKERMLACIANDNGHFEKDIVERGDEDK